MSTESAERKTRAFLGIKRTRTGLLGIVDYIKFSVVIILLFLMLALVAITTVELLFTFGRQLVEGIQGEHSFGEILLDEGVLLGFVGFILTIFIVIELAESVEVYLTENDFHGELVIMVALIAIARKIILLDYAAYDPLVYLGIAGIVAALAWAYYMLKRARQNDSAEARVSVLAEDLSGEADGAEESGTSTSG